MENYQMRRGCGRPYNTTCGMGNQREIALCPPDNDWNAGELPEKKCMLTLIIWNLRWHMFPARILQ